MSSFVVVLLHTLRTSFRRRAALEAEILALRHQLQVLNRSRQRHVRLTRTDRVLWVWLSRIWSGWRTTMMLVKPATVIAWHRRGFRLFWTWKSRRRHGRPRAPAPPFGTCTQNRIKRQAVQNKATGTFLQIDYFYVMRAWSSE